jgi:nitronate monooxygenase
MTFNIQQFSSLNSLAISPKYGQIVHKSNSRLDRDIEICVKHEVPVWITSLGARVEVNEAAHSAGGVVLHDVINNRFARKAIEKGADGLVAVAAGAGGHAGALSPFALVQEIRSWFDGPLFLSGAIARGDSILAALAMGADGGYAGSAFIATDEANAAEGYKRMIADSGADDIVYSNLFTGVWGNYLKPSIAAAGMNPDALEQSDPSKMNFAEDREKPKSWKEIWGSGQGIGAVSDVVPTSEMVARLKREFDAARQRLDKTLSTY